MSLLSTVKTLQCLSAFPTHVANFPTIITSFLYFLLLLRRGLLPNCFLLVKPTRTFGSFYIKTQASHITTMQLMLSTMTIPFILVLNKSVASSMYQSALPKSIEFLF
mmetsp:Transcript_5901/g.749  ORF Transcript_5901/g.749 Transcript_5901/m.749 type:complete len:107 (+) Transcript_5901:501-821(+)